MLGLRTDVDLIVPRQTVGTASVCARTDICVHTDFTFVMSNSNSELNASTPLLLFYIGVTFTE